MKKKRWMRAGWIMLPLMVAAGLYLATKEQEKQFCSGITVVLDNRDEGCFLDEKDILNHLYKLNDTLKGKNISDINVSLMEKQLLKIPYVAEADVYFTLHGMLKVRIRQRKTIARVFDIRQTSAYLSDDGMIMPVMTGHTLNVPVASGEIPDSLNRLLGKNIHSLPPRSILHEIYRSAIVLERDTFYRDLFVQIYVNEQQELELIPGVDDHVVLIGNANDLEYKLSKLMAFYTRGMIRTGWDTYDHINLKYSNQVICSNKQN